MNVYLTPIITELVKLWAEGEVIEDVSVRFTSNTKFILKAILLWVMHDFPGYGVASSLQTQGFYGCPPCGPEEVPSFSALELEKVIYHGHRKFLPKMHKWRSNDYIGSFNGKREHSVEPPKTWNSWDWLANWEKVEARTLPLEESGMKAYSKFFELEYWPVI
jgi:hypothetical protein